MSLFSIDRSKCKSDGLCAQVCPNGIIEMSKSDNMPVAAENSEKRCINCGHCVAVCPYGAFSLDTMPAEKCKQLQDKWNLSPKELEILLKGRRSVRRYKKDTVENKVIEQVIDIARYCPSGINLQMIRWAVLTDPKKVNTLAEITVNWTRGLIKAGSPMAESFHMDKLVSAWDKGEDRICRGAPHLVVAYALKEDMMAPQAAAIALSYFELAAVSFGLGTCWAGYAHMALNACPEAFELLGVSKRCASFGAMMFGYPKFKYFRIPERNIPHIVWR